MLLVVQHSIILEAIFGSRPFFSGELHIFQTTAIQRASCEATLAEHREHREHVSPSLALLSSAPRSSDLRTEVPRDHAPLLDAKLDHLEVMRGDK